MLFIYYVADQALNAHQEVRGTEERGQRDLALTGGRRNRTEWRQRRWMVQRWMIVVFASHH